MVRHTLAHLWGTVSGNRRPADQAENLLDAADRGDPVEVQALLDKGTNVNAQTKKAPLRFLWPRTKVTGT